MMTIETPRTGGALAGLARFCYRRRRLVLLTWIVGVIAVAFTGFGFGAASDNDFSGGDSDSAKAQVLIGPDVSVKQIGLGMAVAVFIDATIVRMILVPAVMELCGKANWWMPGRRAPKATSAAPARLGEETRV